MNPDCQLSVVLVSDFEPSGSRSWKDEKALVQALARQEIDEPYEVILVESAQHRAEPVPASLYEAVPNLQVHYFDSIKSAALKDYGVLQARGRYVAVLESDCLPEPQWLGRLFQIVRNGEWAIASGRSPDRHQLAFGTHCDKRRRDRPAQWNAQCRVRRRTRHPAPVR